MNRHDFIHENEQGLIDMEVDAYETWRDELTTTDFLDFTSTIASGEMYELIELLVDDFLSNRSMEEDHRQLLQSIENKMWKEHNAES